MPFMSLTQKRPKGALEIKKSEIQKHILTQF
jgi:hypothetical protein